MKIKKDIWLVTEVKGLFRPGHRNLGGGRHSKAKRHRLHSQPRFLNGQKAFRAVSLTTVFLLSILIVSGIFLGGIRVRATTPNQITGLNFWLKADAGITQSVNKVSAWADQSASANNATQATGANQPTYVANALNGQPVVRFTGAPVKMGFNAVTAQTVFVVYKDNGTSDDYADILGNHAGTGDLAGDTAASGKLISATYAPAKVTGGQGYVDGTPTAPTSMARAASYHIYSFVPTSTVSFANIANNQDQANRFMKGDYAEIISYSGALSATDRSSVEVYLGAKYGIAVSQITPGVASLTSRGATTATLTSTDATNGTAPYTYQWYRSTTAEFLPGAGNIVSGATSRTLNDTGLTAGTMYYYRLVFTDAASRTATSAQVIVAATPDQITGLNFWLKADAGITQSVNKVSTWADQSTSANNATQVTGAKQPTYITSDLNGKPVVQFTGDPVTMGFNSVVNAQTVFVVYKDNGTTNDYADILGTHLGATAYFSGDTAMSGNLLSSAYAGSNVIGGQAYTDGANTSPASIKVSTSYHIYSFVPTSPVTFQTIANNQDQTARFRKGNYAEIISFSGVLSNTNRQDIEGYLSQKYNLSVTKGAPVVPIKACADGDSVTAYANNYVNGSPGGYYQSDIQSVLNTSATVTNVAVSGQSLNQMYSDINSTNTTLSCKPQNPDIWTVMTSLNDIGYYTGGTTTQTQLKNDIIGYVNTALAMKNASGLPPQVILMTDNLSGQNLSTAYARPWLDQYNTAHFVLNVYNLFANNPNVHIVDNFTPFYNLGVDTTQLYNTLLSDMVHPNQATGYAMFHNGFQASLVAATNRIVNSTLVDGTVSSASPATGTYNTAQNVSLTFPSYAASTYYTLDGTAPNNTKTQYTGGTISVDGIDGTSKTLKVASYDAAGNLGATFTATYIFDKTAPIVSGVTDGSFYNTDKTITFNKGTATLDGTAFISGSIVSTEAAHTLVATSVGGTTTVHFTLGKTAPAVTGVTDGSYYNTNKVVSFTSNLTTMTATLNGIAFISGTTVSAEAAYTLVVTDQTNNSTTVHFTIDKTPPIAPTINPGTGTYNSAQSVIVTPPVDATSTYYTLDGTAPDNTKTAYTGATVTIDGTGGTTKVIKAVSYDSAGNISNVAMAAYTFDKPVPAVATAVTQLLSPAVSETNSAATTTDQLSAIEIKVNDQALLPETTLTLGKPIVFSGVTYPYAEIHLYFHSDPFEAVVYADENGAWSYTLSKDLAAGNHTLQVSVVDPNTTKIIEKTQPATFILIASQNDSMQKNGSGTDSVPSLAGYLWYYAAAATLGLFAIISLVFFVKRRSQGYKK